MDSIMTRATASQIQTQIFKKTNKTSYCIKVGGRAGVWFFSMLFPVSLYVIGASTR